MLVYHCATMIVRKSIKIFITSRQECGEMFSNIFNITMIKNCIYSLLIICILTTCLILNIMINESQEIRWPEDRQLKFPTDVKYILFWRQGTNRKKSFYLQKQPKLLTGQSMFIQQKCKFINCFITYNKNLLRTNVRNFDAVIFNINEIYNIRHKKITLPRTPKQKYIFYSMDSAAIFPVCFPGFDNFFNLTWTYRLDSDVPQPFFDIYNNNNNNLVGPKKNVGWIIDMKHSNKYRKKILNKTKAVAWIVHKCRSRRKHYQLVTDLGRELSGYNYSIDIYGRCGGMNCPEGDILSCYKVIEKDYYFQLVLEDTTTVGHISERMAQAMMHTAIPIIQGDSEYTSYLPPGSYINVQNFTIKETGAIIDYLIKNPKFYSYFFDWKNYYHYKIRQKDYVCDLCAYLNKNSELFRNTYRNFREWWNSNYNSECNQKRLYEFFLDYD